MNDRRVHYKNEGNPDQTTTVVATPAVTVTTVTTTTEAKENRDMEKWDGPITLINNDFFPEENNKISQS